MSNRRKLKRRRGAPRRNSRLRVVAGQSTGVSPRSRRLHAVLPRTVFDETPAVGRTLPAIPETAAKGVHVVVVSLYGAAPLPWRRLELPSAMTLDRLHAVLQETFGWSNFGPHSFVTFYGEFGSPALPGSRAARRGAARRDETGVTLSQVADEDDDEIAYLYGYEDEWRVDIEVEQILAAAPGVAYPRCTRGQGEDIPGEGYAGVWEFNAEQGPFELDEYVDPEELTEDLAELATVIVPSS
jgi:hypothetical protein